MDYLTAFFSNQNVLSIITILIINISWVAMLFAKKKQIPTKLFLLMNFIWLGIFINAGMLDTSFAMVYIIIVSGLITYLYQKEFATGVGGYQKLILTYVIFLSSVVLFEGLGIATSETLNASLNAPTFACSISSVDFLGISLPNIFTLFSCAWSGINIFISFFSFTSSIGIINTFIIVPFLLMLILYLIDWIRGR
jgi:hypothetical protein